MLRRRGNKSHKVPNVKLRPAEKGAYSRPVEESCWAQDSQEANEITVTYDSCPRPMKGFSVCATGVQDKPTLFKQAVELGATCTPAFTDRVTHLVAADHGSAKYMCALERKIPIVTPSWITENYQIWLRGDDVDVEKSIEQHRLPIFSGVVICPSGITDITRRTQISKLVTAHQGEYLKNLERPVRVTHLLCSGDVETDKMRYAEKFNSRGEAKIHLVWEEWFWDSIDFGGRFDEAKYQVRHPRPERKTLPHSSSPPPVSSDVPSEHDEIPSSSVASRQAPAKNADDAEEEPAFVNVLPTVTLQLWGSLLERRGYEINDGEVILSPSKIAGKRKASEQLQPASPVQERKFGAARSVISSFKRTNSFAPVVSGANGGPSRQIPFRRTATAMAVLGNDNRASTSALPTAAPLQKNNTISANAGGSELIKPQASKIFSGMKLRVLGEAKSPTVRSAIEQLGGTITTDEEEKVDFVIVRLVSGSKFYREEEDIAVKAKYRTECWLEQCIYEDRICAPEEQVSSVPLSIQLPIIDVEKIVMATSGFNQSEICGLNRLFRALGITLPSTFTKHSTHLLCPSGTGLKFEKARQWHIPIINLEWLRALTSSGVIPGPHEHLVAGSTEPLAGDQAMDVDVPRKDAKGKGKAVDKRKQRANSDALGHDVKMEVENMMQDITNDSPPDLIQPAPQKKSKNLERRATVIIPNSESIETISFGQPNETLGGPAMFTHPSSIVSPGPSIASPLVQGPRERESGSTLPHLSPRRLSYNTADQNLDLDADAHSHSNPNSNPQRSLQHRETMPVIDVDMERGGRVPSSTSPSPMKIPHRQSSRSSISPVKIDHQATKALQESITSLLGKRPSPDGEEVDAAVAAGVGAGTNASSGGARNGKRQRPQRSKPQSRQPSDTKIPEPPALAPSPAPRVRTRSSRLSQTPSAFGDTSHNLFDSYPDQIDIAKSQDKSIRVMYEDPVQKEEQKRLMSLLKNQSGDDDSISVISGSSRRSTRRTTKIGG